MKVDSKGTPDQSCDLQLHQLLVNRRHGARASVHLVHPTGGQQRLSVMCCKRLRLRHQADALAQASIKEFGDPTGVVFIHANYSFHIPSLNLGIVYREAALRSPIQCLGMTNDELMERLAIRAVVDNWVLWRDAGDWERFRTVWHDDGYMMATWFQGTADEFIRVSKEGFERGVNILHFQGASTADVAGTRAISQTKMTINQRALVHDVVCDVVCTGRFYDFLEKRNNRWGIVLRQPIYEKDRMDPVDPGKLLPLDQELLKRFPEGYRHLAYLQSNIGYKVKTDMPGLKGPEVEALYARGKRWLAGGPVER